MMTAFKNFGSNCFQKYGPLAIDMFKEKKETLEQRVKCVQS